MNCSGPFLQWPQRKTVNQILKNIRTGAVNVLDSVSLLRVQYFLEFSRIYVWLSSRLYLGVKNEVEMQHLNPKWLTVNTWFNRFDSSFLDFLVLSMDLHTYSGYKTTRF